MNALLIDSYTNISFCFVYRPICQTVTKSLRRLYTEPRFKLLTSADRRWNSLSLLTRLSGENTFESFWHQTILTWFEL